MEGVLLVVRPSVCAQRGHSSQLARANQALWRHLGGPLPRIPATLRHSQLLSSIVTLTDAQFWRVQLAAPLVVSLVFLCRVLVLLLSNLSAHSFLLIIFEASQWPHRLRDCCTYVDRTCGDGGTVSGIGCASSMLHLGTRGPAH